MKLSQKEANEFALDLAEFLGKHFSACFDKASIGGGNLDVSVRIRNSGTGSEMGIETRGAAPELGFGGATVHYRDCDSKETLFSRLLTDTLAVFMDGILVIDGFPHGKSQGPALRRGLTDAEAMAWFMTVNPGCQEMEIIRWSGRKRLIPGPGPE